jgi:hypothetical protein
MSEPCVSWVFGREPLRSNSKSTRSKQETIPPEETGGGGMRDWTNSEGKTIRAEALSSNGISVTLKLENGKVVNYPLDKLSEESRSVATETFKSD